jgi:hypothetical protein
MKRIVPFIGVCLACTFLFGKDFWEKKPYLEWTPEEVTRMLTKSPWAAVQKVNRTTAYMVERRVSKQDLPCPSGCDSTTTGQEDVFGAGGTINPEATEAPWKRESASEIIGKSQPVSRYTVRFMTAAPIRMAYAHYLLQNKRISQEQAVEYVKDSGFGDRIVVVVGNLDEDLREFDVPVESLIEEVYLLLKKSKRKLAFEQYVSPRQAGKSEAFFVFPGSEDGNPLVTLEEQEVRFVCRLSSHTKIEKKFKLKKMLFQGELEI